VTLASYPLSGKHSLSVTGWSDEDDDLSRRLVEQARQSRPLDDVAAGG
jgi:hypothetical protein